MYDNDAKLTANMAPRAANGEAVDNPPLGQLTDRIHMALQNYMDRVATVNGAGHRFADRMGGEPGPETAAARQNLMPDHPPLGLAGQIGSMENAVRQLEMVLDDAAHASENMINRITRLG